MFCTNILLDLFLPFRTFNKTANIQWTTICAQISTHMRTKQNGRLLSTCMLQSQIEPLNQKSQIAKEYGLLPADAQQQ